jgi:hypothetical protein
LFTRGGSSLFHPEVKVNKARTDYNLTPLAPVKPGAVQLGDMKTCT